MYRNGAAEAVPSRFWSRLKSCFAGARRLPRSLRQMAVSAMTHVRDPTLLPRVGGSTRPVAEHSQNRRPRIQPIESSILSEQEGRQMPAIYIAQPAQCVLVLPEE